MAKLVFALNQSLDGYVDDIGSMPDPVLFRHFIDEVRGLAGSVYGRRMYEAMRYWDEDRPEWSEAQREYAKVWRKHRKWVASRTLKSVGPNALLLKDDAVTAVAGLKAQFEGEVWVSGPTLAGSLTEVGLVDEYRLYVHPTVLGGGKPFFVGPRSRLRLIASERIGDEVIRLSYVPA
jgi:dihydrofolate reductase